VADAAGRLHPEFGLRHRWHDEEVSG
jgi:hypothetical protein